MNGGQMNDFIGQIANAYQALQEKPALEAQIRDFTDKHILDGQRIADLEQRIHAKDTELASSQDRCRSLEVERDQAQFQVLELEERLNNIARALSSVADTVTDVRATATVAKPEPEAPMVNTEAVNQGQSADHPTAISQDTNATTGPVPYTDVGITQTASEQPDPFATSSDGSQSPNAPTPSAEPSSPVTGPYAGKLYQDHPAYVNYSAWLDGGGTVYGYHYRGDAIDADKSRL